MFCFPRGSYLTRGDTPFVYEAKRFARWPDSPGTPPLADRVYRKTSGRQLFASLKMTNTKWRMSKEARNPNDEVNLWRKRDAHICVSCFVIPSHSGFSTTYRRSVGLEWPLIWLLKIGGGFVEMIS